VSGGGAMPRHYARPGLVETIREALRHAGKDPARLVPADLAPVDEFHVRGRAATAELAEKLRPASGDRVLDIGSGLGGPSRFLAAERDCRVVGIDLTEEYCRAAAALAGWVGLAGRVGYVRGDATRLPFADAAFDHAWTQHVAMNVADKPALYAEVRRVLEPGGRFALYDALQGPGGPAHLPVPWASAPADSHLVTPEVLRVLLAGAGLAVEAWEDATEAARAWFADAGRRNREAGPPPLGIGLVLGPGFAEMGRNLRRNIEEGRVLLVQAVAVRR
jgi:ubiquinone/menaquinone biosynthesis C-methylase UbiE